MKKNIFNRLLLALVAILCCPVVSYGFSFMADGIAYDINTDKETVSVTQLPDRKLYEGDVVIPHKVFYGGRYYTVTEIGNRAFDRRVRWLTPPNTEPQLSSIYIPETVKRIGNSAFYFQNKLKSVIFPNSLSYIGDDAFFRCDNLVTIKLPSSLDSLGCRSFSRCYQLLNADLSETSMKILNNATFWDCERLTEVKLPDELTTIGDSAFLGCERLQMIELPKPLTSLGKYAFCCCRSIKSIKLPNSITQIKPYTFYLATSLVNIELPDNLKSIGASAFLASGLEAFHFPPSLTEIADYAFASSQLKSIFIPNSVKTIGKCAFSRCNNLSYVTLGNSISSIGEDAFGAIIDESSTPDRNLENYSIYLYQSEKARKGSIITITNDYVAMTDLWKLSDYPRIFENLILTKDITKISASKMNTGYGRNKNIFCFADEPPIVSNPFNFSQSTTQLHVPGNAISKYFTAEHWNCYVNTTGDAIAPIAISLNEHNLSFDVGETAQLEATLLNDDETTIAATNNAWYSTNKLVATVDNGKVVAKSKGECDIVTFYANVIDICHVVVNKEDLPDEEVPLSVELEFNDISLFPHEIVTLTPKLNNKELTGPTFSVECDKQDVLMVRKSISYNGITTIQGLALKPGVANITIKCDNYNNVEPAVCKVFVTREISDINVDGIVNAADVSVIYEVILDSDADETMRTISDLNGDGYVNAGDISILYQNIINADK